MFACMQRLPRLSAAKGFDRDPVLPESAFLHCFGSPAQGFARIPNPDAARIQQGLCCLYRDIPVDFRAPYQEN